MENGQEKVTDPPVEEHGMVRSWAKSPAYPTVTTILALITGASGSLFSDEIANAFPFCCWMQPWRPVWPAIWFWTTVILLACLFFVRQKLEDESWRRLTSRAEELGVAVQNVRTDTTAIGEGVQAVKTGALALSKQLQTLPPKAFRSQFADLARRTNYALESSFPRKPGSNSSILQETVRDILYAIAILCLFYDDHPSAGGEIAVYAATLLSG